MRKGKIFKTSYHTEDDELIFDIYGRDLDDERFHLKIHNTEPYFFVKDQPNPAELPYYAEIDGTGETLEGEKLYKIRTNEPWQVGKLRKQFEPHYEADIQYNNRMRYDYGWRDEIEFPDHSEIFDPEKVQPTKLDENIKHRTCVFDIEDIAGTTIEKSKAGRGEVGSIAFWDSKSEKLGIIALGEYDGEKHKEILKEKMEESDVDFDQIHLDDIKIITVPKEKYIFKKFKQFLKKIQPDILVGWNNMETGGGGYDTPVLRNRADKLGIDFDLSPYAEYDIMVADDRLTYHKVRNKLNIRAERLLGTGKIDVPPVEELYDKDRAKFIAYNLWDVILTQRIDEYHDGVRIHQKLASFAGTNIDNCVYQSQIADPYLFHKTKEYTDKGFFDELPIFPSTQFAKEKEGKFKGAYVENPSFGRFFYIAVLDFKSEYPMWMRELNISPDTYEPKPDPNKEYYVTPAGNHYRKEPKGLVPKIMEELLEERNQVKEEMREAKANDNTELYKQLYAEQRGIKILMNSFYGLLGSGGGTFRLSNPQISADVTALAREHIKFTRKIIKDNGYDIKFGDTDSVGFQLDGETYEERINQMDELREELNDRYDELVARFNKDRGRENIRIDKDKLYKIWFQGGAKKRYIGLLEWGEIDMRDKDYGDRLDVTGFESVRSDQADVTEEVQQKSFKTILDEELDNDNVVSELLEYYLDLYHQVEDGEYDEELGREAQLNKPPHQYDTKGAHVVAFENSNKMGIDIDIGDTFFWYYTQSDRRIAIPYGEDVPEGINVDRKRLYRKTIFKKVKPLLEPFMKGKVKLDMILDQETQMGMDDFF